MNSGIHVRAQCCFTELQDGLGLKRRQRSSSFRTMVGRHILLVSSSKTRVPTTGRGLHSPSGCAHFLGLSHCLISSSLLFSALLPAREHTQELFQGLSTDSSQENQDLYLCQPGHIKTSQKRSAKEEGLFLGPQIKLRQKKKKLESKGCMRKAFPKVPPSPRLEAEWCPAWSCFFPRQTKFQVPLQISAILEPTVQDLGAYLRCSYNPAWSNKE